MQIVQELQIALGTEDVACVIDAKHLCVNSRGISESSTVTSEFGGKFKDNVTRREFWIISETKFSLPDPLKGEGAWSLVKSKQLLLTFTSQLPSLWGGLGWENNIYNAII
jgi:hypothetical protein